MARKRKYINRHTLKALAEAQLSNDEISAALRVSWSTIARRYEEPIKIWRHDGVASVRRKLYTTAMSDDKGKVPCMIFFLKNFGGMADVNRNEESKKLDFDGLPVSSEFRPSEKPN